MKVLHREERGFVVENYAYYMGAYRCKSILKKMYELFWDLSLSKSTNTVLDLMMSLKVRSYKNCKPVVNIVLSIPRDSKDNQVL